jgi:hypothetical protein
MNINNQIFNILSIKNPKKLYQINKAKQAYIVKHPECAVCGNVKSVECHHVIPVHVDILESCSTYNFISLCDSFNNGCHKWLGHFGNFKTKWNPDIRQYAVASRLFLQKMQPDRHFIVSTQDLIYEYADALDLSRETFIEQVQLFNK